MAKEKLPPDMAVAYTKVRKALLEAGIEMNIETAIGLGVVVAETIVEHAKNVHEDPSPNNIRAGAEAFTKAIVGTAMLLAEGSLVLPENKFDS